MASILVIDDDPDICNLLKSHLSAHGHRVMAVHDGGHGIGAIAQRQPDMVILDLNMPVLDGQSAMNIIRADPNLSHIPILVLTANADDATKQTMLEAGCAAYVTKPFDFDALDAAVAHTLNTAR